MKLKLTIALALLASIQLPLLAQQKANLALRAGLNFQTIRGTDAMGDNMHNKFKDGYHAGIDVQIPLGVDIFLQPGLLYSMKGGRMETGGHEVSLSYIEMPVMIVHNPKVGNGLKYGRILMGIGAYIAKGLEGTYQYASGEKHDIPFGNRGNDANTLVNYNTSCKKFDFGVNGLMGYEFSRGIFLQLNGQLGLAKINVNTPDPNDHTSWRNGGLGVSMGYRF